MDPSTMYLTAFLIIGGIIFLVLFFHYVPFFLWLSAKVSGVNISLVQLFLMRIRNVPPYIIVPGMIEAHKAGLQNITRDEQGVISAVEEINTANPQILADRMLERALNEGAKDDCTVLVMRLFAV